MKDPADKEHNAGSANGHSTTQHNTKSRGPVIGILLLDPTIKEGHPLWQHYRNWNRVPPFSEGGPIPADSSPAHGEEDSSFFNDFLYWASRPTAFNFGSHRDEPQGREPSPVCIPTQALLHLVCTEWLTLVDYIKTRLNQVDWEIAFPGNFLAKDEQIEKALGKLHYWRRVVPVYRAMLAETFLRVFRETKHPGRGDGIFGGGGGGPIEAPNALDDRQSSLVAQAAAPTAVTTTTTTSSGGTLASARQSSALDDLMNRECINAYKQDFTLVLNYLEEYQARIDRLTGVVTAVISIQDSRRGYKDNKNLQWLTWLATLFIPLSFVATMLSMTTGPLDELRDATVLWAEVSIPSGLFIMSVVMLMSIAKCRRAIRGFFIEFPWTGGWRPFNPRSK